MTYKAHFVNQVFFFASVLLDERRSEKREKKKTFFPGKCQVPSGALLGQCQPEIIFAKLHAKGLLISLIAPGKPCQTNSEFGKNNLQLG